MQPLPFTQTFWGAIVVAVIAGVIVLLVQRNLFEAGQHSVAPDAGVTTALTAPSSGAMPTEPTPIVTISGLWRGTFNNNGKIVPFTWLFDSTACRGRSEEPNTFANPSYAKLFANLSCTTSSLSSGQTIIITKTYDGTAGVSHSVLYTGTVSLDLRQISGQWAIGPQRGSFLASR